MAEHVKNPQNLDDADFLRRAWCYLESHLSKDELPQFQVELAANPEKRRRFVQLCLTRAALIEELHKPSANAAAPNSGVGKAAFELPGKNTAWRLAAILLFVASAVFALTSPLWWGWKAAPLATLTDAVDAQWDNAGENMPQGGLSAGDALPRGSLVLQSGYVQITLSNGVKLVIQGPAHFDVATLALVHLDVGKLTADVPHTTSGFTVRMPTASVTDLGTTFGVTAYANGEAAVQVLQGKVQAKLLTQQGATKVETELTQDHAVGFNPFLGTVAGITVEPDAYVTNIHHIPPALLPREDIAALLHNTGQGLNAGDADPNWQITANTDDPTWTPKAAIATTPVNGVAAQSAARLAWLCTGQPSPNMSPHCLLTFSTTLDMTGFDPNSIHLHLALLVDNYVVAVRLNGKTTPIKLTDKVHNDNADYVTTHQQFDLKDGFVAGKNTLEIVVSNAAFPAPYENDPNPMGLCVELSGTAQRPAGSVAR